jgi:ketosteroid isomerase-like protein
MDETSEAHIAVVKAYFRKGDAGDPTILDMFTNDIELRFPKYGTRFGKAAVGIFVQGLLTQLRSLKHFPDEYVYVATGDVVVVEGWETGVLKDGTSWPVVGCSDGEFCNVFRFRDDLISHLHVYVDPDFAGRDKDRFFWKPETPSSENVMNQRPSSA